MRGFTLIELLVVIAIMAILTIIAVPSYNDYSRNQKLNDAASQLQSVLRQAQNNAQTGTVCQITGGTSKAVYWYVDLNSAPGSNSAYSLSPKCESGSQSSQQINLPLDVTISNLNLPLTNCSSSNTWVQFINISSEVKFYDRGGMCPDTTNARLEITLLVGSSNTRTVVVEKGGGIYVKK